MVRSARTLQRSEPGRTGSAGPTASSSSHAHVDLALWRPWRSGGRQHAVDAPSSAAAVACPTTATATVAGPTATATTPTTTTPTSAAAVVAAAAAATPLLRSKMEEELSTRCCGVKWRKN